MRHRCPAAGFPATFLFFRRSSAGRTAPPLQTALAAVQAQVVGILGTTSVSGPANDIIEAADELSEFSDVGTEGRNIVDSLGDWFSCFKSRISSQTNSYTQLTNNYTSPALSSVSNADALADVDLLGTAMTL